MPDGNRGRLLSVEDEFHAVGALRREIFFNKAGFHAGERDSGGVGVHDAGVKPRLEARVVAQQPIHLPPLFFDRGIPSSSTADIHTSTDAGSAQPDGWSIAVLLIDPSFPIPQRY
jgi:hypothetical protein